LLLLDMIFPGVYGALLALLANRWACGLTPVRHGAPSRSRGPIIAAAADYFENILLLGVIASVPKKIPSS